MTPIYITKLKVVHLDNVLAQVLLQWGAVQEAVVQGVTLSEAQPPGQIWEQLPVALEHHRVIIHPTCVATHRQSKMKQWPREWKYKMCVSV